MKALNSSSADNSNCFLAAFPGVARESCAGLLRLARLLSLLAFSVRSGAGVHAVAFAPIVPGACGDRANDHQKEQYDPPSIRHFQTTFSCDAPKCTERGYAAKSALAVSTSNAICDPQPI
jgi:hypothetical protein